MTSLNVTQDDMIDILIGHANVGIAMNTEQNHPNPLPPIQTPLQPPSQQPLLQPPPPNPTSHSYQETYTQLIPSHPSHQLPPHNQYVCRGCHQSILYTNRSSLVQLLSLHQQKCPGSQQYRYMCLECHNAFKSVTQLQMHESNCRGRLGRDNKAGIINDKQQIRNCTGTGSVIQSLPHEGAVQHSSHSGVQDNNDNSRLQYQQQYSQDGYPADNKFPLQFFNNGSANNHEHNKKSENQSGVIQNLTPQQDNCGQTSDEKVDSFKMPSLFYQPNAIDTAKILPLQEMEQQGRANTSRVIQSMTEIKESTTARSETHGIQQVNNDTKKGDFIHSMSENLYEQPERTGNSSGASVTQPDARDASHSHQETGSSNKDVIEQKVLVRDSWSQTFEQPPEEVQEDNVLLDEISPAGRTRRTCARKLKVYREKELRKQREHAEMESLKRLAYGRRRAKVFKQQLRIVKGEEKVLKKEEKETKVVIKKGTKVKEPKEGKKMKEKKERKPKKEKEPDLAIPMQCQQCPKTFTKYSMYTRHYQYYHERAMCQYCGTQCIRRKLKSHEASHLKAYKCTYPGCAKVVNSKHRLTRHSRIHTGEKPFKCEVCNKAFAGKENMVKHRKRVHDGEKPYQCRYCGRKFADTGRLKYHEGTHTKPRPTDYRCKFCGRGYKSHVGCYLHERTHTGNTVKCQYCGKAFMAKEHLKRHEYIHTGNYPFRCPNCQKGFKDAGSMRKHKCLAVL